MRFRIQFLLPAFFALIAISAAQSPEQPDPTALLRDLNSDFERIAPQTIRPADGYIKYPYLIPSGIAARDLNDYEWLRPTCILAANERTL